MTANLGITDVTIDDTGVLLTWRVITPRGESVPVQVFMDGLDIRLHDHRHCAPPPEDATDAEIEELMWRGAGAAREAEYPIKEERFT